MAQLVHCPACSHEVALPEQASASEAQEQWFACPNCSKVFCVADAEPYEVKQAAMVDPPTRPAGDEDDDIADVAPPSSPAADASLPPKFGSATLSSFMDEKVTRSDAENQAEAPAVADFQSLDDLIRRGPSELLEFDSPEPAAQRSEPAGADADGAKSNTNQDDRPLDEPSPAADRIRPTLGELFRTELGATSDIADAASYDRVDDAAGDSDTAARSHDDSMNDTKTVEPARSTHDFSVPSSFESTLRDHGDLGDTEVASTVPDAPSFDFEVGDSRAAENGESLRAAMGFDGEEPLEVEEPVDRPNFDTIGTNESHEVAPELNVDADAPHGKVAARKRSSVLSGVRTLVGVAGGGVVGIVAGYLLLLWIFHFLGRTNEPLALAQYYPNAIKPSSFQDANPVAPTAATAGTGDGLAANDSDGEIVAELEPLDQSEVETANFETEMMPPDDTPEPWEFESQPAPPALVMGAPSFKASELQELTSAAETVAPALAAAGPIDKAKGSGYANIAKLAEALTFGEGAADVSWKNNAREVFPPLFATEENRTQVATIAEFWLVSPKRGHGGIFFSGTPDAGRQQGSVAEYTFTLPTANGQQFTVLTPRALAVETVEAGAAVVIGAVVDDPQNRIDGYTGSAEKVIWSTDVYPITQ